MENKDNNIVVNAKPNTILLQSTEEEVTGGYYDGAGEWHEFGGGGEVTPILTIAVQNDDTFPYTFGGETLTTIENNKVFYREVSVAPGESDSFTVLVINKEFNGESGFFFDSLSGSEIVSDMVNCTYDEDDEYIIITDPTKNASVHLVIPQV